MGLLDLEFKKVRVPLYDIVTLVAGFWIGYSEGKGIDTSATTEYLTKYGPTAFAVIGTPIMGKLSNSFGKCMNKAISQNLENGNLKVTLQDGSKKRYGDINENERDEITPKLVKGIYNLESKLQNPEYLKHTLAAGARTAIESTVGYVAGRLCSQING